MATRTAVRFYLVRHAKAEAKGAKDDAARRLTRDGQRDALGKILGRQPDHAIGLERGMIGDGRHGVR